MAAEELTRPPSGRSDILKQTISLAVLFLSPLTTLTAAERPNVVYLLADDLRCSDISTHAGGSIPTPPVARLCTAEVPILAIETWVKTVPKASISFS